MLKITCSHRSELLSEQKNAPNFEGEITQRIEGTSPKSCNRSMAEKRIKLRSVVPIASLKTHWIVTGSLDMLEISVLRQ